MVVNLDLKKVQIRTDINLAGNKIGQLKVDPWLLGVGVGWRF
jgi:outer membrane protein